MQVHDRGGEEFELPTQPAIPDPCAFFSPSDEAFALARQSDDRALTALLSTIALVASFGLGWVGGQIWPDVASTLGLSSVAQKEEASAQKEEPSPRLAKAVPAAKHAAISKPSPAPALQASPGPSAASHAAAISSTIATAVARLSSDATGTVSPATQSINESQAAAPGPLAPAPETRPATIPGWTVIDVREGTAVLDGPYGSRMVRRGDTIAGIGRVDSIVRWGNRWIVATSNGLIATP